MSLHDDAWNNTLTSAKLSQYLQSQNIDSIGGPKSITPLAAASLRGNLEAVRVLLEGDADPNAPSPPNRTPLFFATSQSPPTNRAAIVRALLDKGADVDASSAEDGHNTPLMNALVEIRDADVVHELIDRGASISAKNNKGKSVQELAKQVGMVRDIRPRADRESNKSEIIDLVVALVMFIIAYVNSGVIKGVVKGIAEQLYGITGEAPQDIKDEMGDIKTPKQLVTAVDNYVKDSGLTKFFSPNDPFLHDLAQKATKLADDGNSDLGRPENIKRLTVLSLYQPVIYCDDSLSMNSQGRFENQRHLVSRIARVATKIVPDKFQHVPLRFINSNILSSFTSDTIDEVLKSSAPMNGGTKIGTNLRNKILNPLVYDVLNQPGGRLERPFLVCAITDGVPNIEARDTFKMEIANCREFLISKGYEPSAVMFCISQIGDDEDAKEFLDGLRDDDSIQDVLYAMTDRLDEEYKKLRTNEKKLEVWLLHLLTKPIMERYGN